MRYDKIEKAIVDLVTPLKLASGATLGEKCDSYDGEFESPFSSPEDYSPACRYVLVDARGAVGESKSINGYSMSANCDLVLFVGSEGSSRRKVKAEVFEMLDKLQGLVHKKTLVCDGQPIGTLRWRNDAREFAKPNHVCFSMTLTLETIIRIENV